LSLDLIKLPAEQLAGADMLVGGIDMHPAIVDPAKLYVPEGQFRQKL
jgi:hypothetical protein